MFNDFQPCSEMACSRPISNKQMINHNTKLIGSTLENLFLRGEQGVFFAAETWHTSLLRVETEPIEKK
jgi:ureidoglycolate hydrolase